MLKSKWLYLVIGLTLVTGLVLRFYNLSHQSYWMDEGYSITLAKTITQHGYPLLDSGTIIWRDPGYHYLLAGMVKLFGTGELATRSLSVLAGITTCLLLGYIAWQWLSIQAGAITLALMATSYWEIGWSRQARMYIFLQLFFWLTLFLFERYDHGDKITRKKILPWLITSTVLTILMHQFGLLLLIATGLGWIVWQKQFKLVWYCISILGAIILVVLAVHLFAHQTVWVNYWAQYVSFLTTYHLVTLLLALIGLILALRTKLAPLALWLFGIAIIGLGICSFAITLLEYRYLFFLWPIVILFAAYAIGEALKFSPYTIIVSILLLALSHEYMIIPQANIWLESDSPNNTFPYKSFTPQPDFKAAYQFISTLLNNQTIITPYPALTKLYLHRNDLAAFYIDLTGNTPNTSHKTEPYTGMPYISLEQLQHDQQSGQHAIILLDTLAQYRIDQTLVQYIQAHAKLIYHSALHDWSNLELYQL